MVRGVRSVAVDMEAHRVDVVGTAAAADVLAAVAAAGYGPVLIGVTDADAAPQGKACPKPEPPAGGGKAERGGGPATKSGQGGGGEQASQGGQGGQGHVKTVGLAVEGMTCSSCVAAIEGLLLGLEGVTHASISLMGKSAQISYDERRVDVPSLLARVASAGYSAEVQADGNLARLSSSFDAESRQWRRRFVGRRGICMCVHVCMCARVARTCGAPCARARARAPALAPRRCRACACTTVCVPLPCAACC